MVRLFRFPGKAVANGGPRETEVPDGFHIQPFDAGECGDDVLGDPVGEELLVRIAAHIGTGQHGNRRLVRQREGTYS
jgi:hypothetical protein